MPDPALLLAPDVFQIYLYAKDSARHPANEVTFVEACKPDHGRVIVAYPGPGLLPREAIAARFRGG
jgi:hypothetical protein